MFICMTASLYSIAKVYLLHSKYKTNNTNNKLKKKIDTLLTVDHVHTEGNKLHN